MPGCTGQLVKFKGLFKASDLTDYPLMLELQATIGTWTGELMTEAGRTEIVTARGIEIGGYPVGERNYKLGMYSKIASKR